MYIKKLKIMLLILILGAIDVYFSENFASIDHSETPFERRITILPHKGSLQEDSLKGVDEAISGFLSSFTPKVSSATDYALNHFFKNLGRLWSWSDIEEGATAEISGPCSLALSQSPVTAAPRITSKPSIIPSPAIPPYSLIYNRISECDLAIEKGSWLDVLAAVVYGLDRDTLFSKRKSTFEASLNLLESFEIRGQGNIPLLTNRIWLTGKGDQTHEAPQQSLEHYVKSLKMLADWEGGHHFWCVDPKDMPRTIEFLKSSVPNITIHSIEELKFIKDPDEERKGVKKLFDAYMTNKLYCLASDILRLVILNERRGGFYSDIGAEVLEAEIIRFYADSCNAIFFCWDKTGFLDTCFLGLSPTNPTTERYLSTLNNLILGRLPPHFKQLTSRADGTQDLERQMLWTVSSHVMSAFYSTHEATDKVLFVPDGSLIKIHHNSSWGCGEHAPKFGQVSRVQSKLDIFEIE